MREITCGDGTEWRVLLVAETGAYEAPRVRPALWAPRETQDGIDAAAVPAVVLLRCTSCREPTRHVSVRVPEGEWRTIEPQALCRLIERALRSGADR